MGRFRGSLHPLVSCSSSEDGNFSADNSSNTSCSGPDGSVPPAPGIPEAPAAADPENFPVMYDGAGPSGHAHLPPAVIPGVRVDPDVPELVKVSDSDDDSGVFGVPFLGCLVSRTPSGPARPATEQPQPPGASKPSRSHDKYGPPLPDSDSSDTDPDMPGLRSASSCDDSDSRSSVSLRTLITFCLWPKLYAKL